MVKDKEKNSWIYLTISVLTFIFQFWLAQESETAETNHKMRLSIQFWKKPADLWFILVNYIVVAILAFDSTESLERMKFNSDSSKKIAQGWAHIIRVVMDE